MAPKPSEIINAVKINTAKISPSSLPCAKSDVASTFLRLLKSVHRLDNKGSIQAQLLPKLRRSFSSTLNH
jgi:hypothetical protein